MRRKTLTLLVCVLGCLALVSVGFAAWVITNDASSGDAGQIRVDVVEDMRLDISAEIEGDNTINYGSKPPKASSGWMIYEQTIVDGQDLSEKLTVTVKVTVGNFSRLNSDGTALSLTLSEDGSTKFKEAVRLGFVKELPSLALSVYDIQKERYGVKDYQYDTATDTATFKVVFNLEWGYLFDFDHEHKYESMQIGDNSPVEMCECGKVKPSAHECDYYFGKCKICGAEQVHEHVMDEAGYCSTCGLTCPHEFVLGKCTLCGTEHNHGTDDASACDCNIPGVVIRHTHEYNNEGICSCGERLAQNPIDHYNQFSYSKPIADYALMKLEQLKEVLDNVSYVLTVEASADLEN